MHYIKCLFIGWLVGVSVIIQLPAVKAQYFPFMPFTSQVDSCQTAMIPCGGHTQMSCSNYCETSGYAQGRCDGSCCMCVQTPPSTGLPRNVASQFFNIPNLNVFPRPARIPFTDFKTARTLLTNSIFQNDISGKEVCSTAVCHDAANMIKSQMDESIQPCDDFYEFACGGFTRQNDVAQDQRDKTHFTLIRDTVAEQIRVLLDERVSQAEAKPFVLAKNLYKSCMNTRAIEALGFQPITKVVNEVGGWPVLDGAEWHPLPEFRWENFAIWYKEMGLPIDYFVRISVDQDSRNTQKRNIIMTVPNLASDAHVMKRGLNEPAVNDYYNYMVNMATLMGADRQQAQIDMLSTVNFEVSLAQCFPGDMRTMFYIPMTIRDLSVKYPSVPWLEMFQRIFPSTVHVTNHESIMVSPNYLECFVSLAQRTEARTLANYAVWRMVAASIPFLHQAARDVELTYLSARTGVQQRQPRWKECTEIVASHLKNAIGAMYIRRYFPETSKRYALEMVKDIQRAFLDILNEADWMDSYTKRQAREKASAIQMHVGYPEEHKSDAKLVTLYSIFDFYPNDYYGNIRNLLSGSFNVSFNQLRKPYQRGDWSVHGKNADVNAFYIPLENAIQLPAAILQGQFFNASKPKYLNYASIGWIIGHEITHGFDDQGHLFDKTGNHKNWWDETTKTTFHRKKQCIIDQYNGYQSQLTGARVSGERTQGENIADNGGIKQAYRGYQYWLARNGEEKLLPDVRYTSQQLFWIAAAQNWCAVQRPEFVNHLIASDFHAPPEFRVRGTFANNADFARDFRCPSGSRMNPSKKCSVW